MTKEEILKVLDNALIDYEIVGEHSDSFHILVKADEDEEENNDWTRNKKVWWYVGKKN